MGWLALTWWLDFFSCVLLRCCVSDTRWVWVLIMLVSCWNCASLSWPLPYCRGQGSGLAAPVIGVKPDTWSSWLKLSDAMPRGGVTLVEHHAVQGSGSSRVGPIIGIGSGRHAEGLELQKWCDAWIATLTPFISQAPAFA